MELKPTNPNGEIALASKLNHVELLKKVVGNFQIFKNKSYKLFFQEDA